MEYECESQNANITQQQQPNDYLVEINCIRDIIENMNKFNQVEILRILHKYNIQLNENKYGVHVNLTDINVEIINEIKTFIKYVNTQENTLDIIEQKKENFKTTYFSKDNKDI